MKHRFLRRTAVVLTAVLLCSSFAYRPTPVKADDLNNMQDKLDSISQKKEQLEKELAIIGDKIDAEYETKDLLDQQINELQTEISVLNDVLSTTEEKLEEKSKQLEEATEKLEAQSSLAKERIRATYEAGTTGYLEILLSAENLFDFISRAEIAAQIAAEDQKVIQRLSETKAELESAKKEIEKNQAAQEKAKNQLVSSQDSLESKQKRSDKIIDKLNSDEKANLAALKAAEKEEARLQKEILAELADRKDSTDVTYSEGEWHWPIKGYYTITSKFGMRTHPTTGVYKLHSGCDISSSGIRGKPITAAKAGKVIKAGYSSAYGNYVTIDHGGGYATLYAHASSLAVSKNDYVTKGQVIAYVGSSGYSTGPHLHFEVIVNGEYKNPLNYYPNLSFKYA